MSLVLRITPFALLVLAAGCAAPPMGPTVQVMPGPGKSFDAFQNDQATCKGFASNQVRGQAEAANQNAAGAAAIGTLGGAALGAAIGAAAGNAGAGAAIGAGTGLAAGGLYGANGTANAQASIQAQYDNAYSQCTYSRGNQVPGYAPIATAPPTAPHPVSDPLVSGIQAQLIRLGLLSGSADGVMGPRTRGAISNYQKMRGLPVDGAPSQALLADLKNN